MENHLKRIVFCVVITFVFTMKARFCKNLYISLYLYSDFVIEYVSSIVMQSN